LLRSERPDAAACATANPGGRVAAAQERVEQLRLARAIGFAVRRGHGARRRAAPHPRIARTVDDDARRQLRVRIYHSLPSIAAYGIDDRTFISVFLHGELAVNPCRSRSSARIR